ncbi:transposase [Salipiger pacificus]|nr:transposase [Alloyangia pacifica]
MKPCRDEAGIDSIRFLGTARAKLALAKLHKRIADIRNALLHEVSDMLTRRFDTIVLEDLNVRGMVRNRKLARAISDAGFGTLRSQIEYKAALRGCEVILADRFYPSSKTCSGCGVVKESLSLSERTFHCADCGLVLDRDLNAALNLERLPTLPADAKRTHEIGKSSAQAGARLLTA